MLHRCRIVDTQEGMQLMPGTAFHLGSIREASVGQLSQHGTLCIDRLGDNSFFPHKVSTTNTYRLVSQAGETGHCPLSPRYAVLSLRSPSMTCSRPPRRSGSRLAPLL
jgi:hypothetical protein